MNSSGATGHLIGISTMLRTSLAALPEAERFGERLCPFEGVEVVHGSCRTQGPSRPGVSSGRIVEPGGDDKIVVLDVSCHWRA